MGYESSSGLVQSVPRIQIRHKSVVVYYEPLYWKCRRNNRKTWITKDLHKTAYSGKVTQGVRKRMTKAVNLLLQTIAPKWVENSETGKWHYHKLSFITLKITNAESVTAREAYDTCFNHFMDWMTRTAGVKLYVWKIEMEKRGQIHYHITTPTFIPWQHIRAAWNNLLRKAGYLDQYAEANGHFDANSTDIHEVNDVTDLARYIIKAFSESVEAADKMKEGKKGKSKTDIAAEMTKDVQNETATVGKIWGCSELLSAAHYVSFYMDQRHEDIILQFKIDGKVREVSDDSGRWYVYYFNDTSPPDLLNTAENNFVVRYLKWQLEKPVKGSPEVDLLSWGSRKPILN